MNRTVAAEIGSITREELKALRAADDVILRHRHERTTLEAYRRTGSKPLDPVGGCYLAVEVGAEFSQYGPDKVEDPVGRASCFGSVGNWEDSSVRAALAFVRPGDRLRLLWIRDNGNEPVRNAGLVHDEVKLVVLRDMAKRTERYVFPLEDSITPNNSARLFRKAFDCD